MWVWDKNNTSAFGVHEMARNMLYEWKQRCLERHMYKAVKESRYTGPGCVFRDERGAFIRARNKKIEATYHPREVEAMSLKEALSWAKDLGYKRSANEVAHKLARVTHSMSEIEDVLKKINMEVMIDKFDAMGDWSTNCRSSSLSSLAISSDQAVSAAVSAASEPELTWQILVGALAGVIPFIVAAIEFSKRIVAQKKCEICQGSGLVLMDKKEYIRCPDCGGFLPWQSWNRFFSG
ncbi:hypothetical protein AgCh_031454 [Apium graveolens]